MLSRKLKQEATKDTGLLNFMEKLELQKKLQLQKLDFFKQDHTWFALNLRRNRLSANIEVQNRLLQEALFKPYDPQYFKYVQGIIEETAFVQETRKLQEAHD